MRTLRTACFGFAVAMMTASSAHAVGESVGGFPNWRERTLHQFMNRARVDPASDLAACPSANCLEKSCYKAVAPLYYDLKLGRAARFHSDEMKQQGYFAHDSKCAIVSNISTIYPGQCSGAASCACMAGTATSWSARVQRHTDLMSNTMACRFNSVPKPRPCASRSWPRKSCKCARPLPLSRST